MVVLNVLMMALTIGTKALRSARTRRTESSTRKLESADAERADVFSVAEAPDLWGQDDFDSLEARRWHATSGKKLGRGRLKE